MVGGRERLARTLQVPASEVEKWILGDKKPPREAFLRVVDLIVADGAAEESRAAMSD